MLSFRTVLIITVVTICLHLILLANKTYKVGGVIYNSKDQYHLYIVSTDADVRNWYVSNTQINYFDILPEWTPNLFYAFEVLLIIAILYRPSKGDINQPGQLPGKPIKKPGESLSDYAKRVADWQDEQKIREQAKEEIKNFLLKARIALLSKARFKD